MGNSNQNESFFKKSLGGLFLTSVGLFSMYYFIYLPSEEMKQGGDINYSFKGILLGPAIFVMGIYVLLFTPGGKFSLQSLSSKEKQVFYFALLLGFALGFFALYWVNNELSMCGYDTSNL